LLVTDDIFGDHVFYGLGAILHTVGVFRVARRVRGIGRLLIIISVNFSS